MSSSIEDIVKSKMPDIQQLFSDSKKSIQVIQLSEGTLQILQNGDTMKLDDNQLKIVENALILSTIFRADDFKEKGGPGSISK